MCGFCVAEPLKVLNCEMRRGLGAQDVRLREVVWRRDSGDAEARVVRIRRRGRRTWMNERRVSAILS